MDKTTLTYEHDDDMKVPITTTMVIPSVDIWAMRDALRRFLLAVGYVKTHVDEIMPLSDED